MAEERQWQGKTGGGNFGQKALFFILRHIRVFWLYPTLYFAIPFYLLFSRQGTQALQYYYKNILKYNKLKSFFSYFKMKSPSGRWYWTNLRCWQAKATSSKFKLRRMT